MAEEHTQRLSPSGSWHNHTVIERHRGEDSYYRPDHAVAGGQPDTTRRPAFALARAFLCTLLALVALLTAVSGALAYWAQTNLIDSAGFATISDSMAEDTDFQAQLAQAVTDDLMSAEAITTYLGEGDETGLLGSVQNLVYDQLRDSLSAASLAVVQSEDYSAIWNQVMADTHDYNFTDSDQPAALDISAIYRSIDDRVGSFMGVDPDIDQAGNHLMSIDSADGSTPVHTFLINLKNYAGTWRLQLLFSAALFLLATVLYPRGKLYFAATVLLVTAGFAWVAGAVTWPLASLSTSLNIESQVGKVFVQGLAEKLDDSLAAFSSSLITPLLICALILFLAGLAVQMTKLTARATTARTRN